MHHLRGKLKPTTQSRRKNGGEGTSRKGKPNAETVRIFGSLLQIPPIPRLPNLSPNEVLLKLHGRNSRLSQKTKERSDHGDPFESSNLGLSSLSSNILVGHV